MVFATQKKIRLAAICGAVLVNPLPCGVNEGAMPYAGAAKRKREAKECGG